MAKSPEHQLDMKVDHYGIKYVGGETHVTRNHGEDWLKLTPTPIAELILLLSTELHKARADLAAMTNNSAGVPAVDGAAGGHWLYWDVDDPENGRLDPIDFLYDVNDGEVVKFTRGWAFPDAQFIVQMESMDVQNGDENKTFNTLAEADAWVTERRAALDARAGHAEADKTTAETIEQGMAASRADDLGQPSSLQPDDGRARPDRDTAGTVTGRFTPDELQAQSDAEVYAKDPPPASRAHD